MTSGRTEGVENNDAEVCSLEKEWLKHMRDITQEVRESAVSCKLEAFAARPMSFDHEVGPGSEGAQQKVRQFYT